MFFTSFRPQNLLTAVRLVADKGNIGRGVQPHPPLRYAPARDIYDIAPQAIRLIVSPRPSYDNLYLLLFSLYTWQSEHTPHATKSKQHSAPQFPNYMPSVTERWLVNLID